MIVGQVMFHEMSPLTRPTMLDPEAQDSLGVYVHLPFCRVRCTYCAFAVSTEHSMEAAYVTALESEIRTQAVSVASSSVDSLYFGGGTPSRMQAEHLFRIFRVVSDCFPLAPECEITLEANPEDIHSRNLSAWKEMGVNRLSIGVQSLDDRELIPLGRSHGASAARHSLRLARDFHFRLSADLILGLPGQTPGSFAASLESVIEANPGHISLYILDLEEGTVLDGQVRAGRRVLPPDDETVEMYLYAVTRLSRDQYHQYEVSNFSREGQQSRHNLRYWKRLPYLGLGVGAHSFMGQERRSNSRDLHHYIERLSRGESAVDFRETLSSDEKRHEQLFLSLRQTSGLGYADLVHLAGEEGMQWAERGLKEGWLQTFESGVAFTPNGFLLSNEYISQLF